MLHARFMQGSVGFAQSSEASDPCTDVVTFLGTGHGVQGLRAHPSCPFRLSFSARLRRLACLNWREPLAFGGLLLTYQTCRSKAVAFELPPLPYAYDALQPYMSAETLQYHHDKHHKAYVDNLNKLLPGWGLAGKR